MFQGSHIEKVNLKPCKIKDGFFVTECGKMSVSKDGLVFVYSSGKIYGHNRNIPGEYIQVGSRPLHVVIAETFLEIPVGFKRESLIVNHRDGIKTNNQLSNLEWATYSWNSKHAYLTGLRSDNVKLKTKNIETGKIEKFNSIWDCARHFKVNGGRVHGYLYRKIREASFLGTHLLVRDDEEFPTDEESKSWVVSDNRMSVIAFNKHDKKAVIFQTATQAGKHFGINQQTISIALKRAKLKGRYYVEVRDVVIVPIQYGKDYRQFVVEDRCKSEWIRTYPAPRRSKPKVRLINLETNEVTIYEDIYKVCKMFGYGYHHFRTNLVNMEGGEMFYKHFKIEFVTA